MFHVAVNGLIGIKINSRGIEMKIVLIRCPYSLSILLETFEDDRCALVLPSFRDLFQTYDNVVRDFGTMWFTDIPGIQYIGKL